MEAVCSYGMLVSTYKTTQHLDPKDYHLNSNHETFIKCQALFTLLLSFLLGFLLFVICTTAADAGTTSTAITSSEHVSRLTLEHVGGLISCLHAVFSR
jgi:hypothetical protein